MKEFTLWKFNRITGYWVHVRGCTAEDAEEWCRMFSQDEPGEYFYLTAWNRKPKHDPVPRDRSASL